MATGRATLRELMTFYSVEDAYLINEVAAIEMYNSYLMNKSQPR